MVNGIGITTMISGGEDQTGTIQLSSKLTLNSKEEHTQSSFMVVKDAGILYFYNNLINKNIEFY